MKTINQILFVFALAASLAFAQLPQSGTSVTRTTLSGTVTAGQTTIAVASTSGCPASGTFNPVSNPCTLIVEHEQMDVQAINGTTLTVQRGASGSIAEAHTSGVAVFIGSSSAVKPATNFQPNYFNTGYTWFPTFSVSNAAAVNSATDVSGKLWYSGINIPYTTVLTGACLLNGGGTVADNVVVAIWDKAGTLLQQSAAAGVTQSGASILQCTTFSKPVLVQGPQMYFVGVQGNGTTAGSFSLYAAGGAPTNYPTGVQTGGTFGTVLNITSPATTFTANAGPIMAVF